jgi:hypothetical protein
MAMHMYSSCLEKFEDNETNSNLSTSVSFGNHSKCTLDNEEYMVFSRIDDTCVAIVADNAKKSENKDVLKELGYRVVPFNDEKREDMGVYFNVVTNVLLGME